MMIRALPLVIVLTACSGEPPPLPSALGPSPSAPAVALLPSSEPTVSVDPNAVVPPAPPVIAQTLPDPVTPQTAEQPYGTERFSSDALRPPAPDRDRATRVPRATDVPTATGEFR